MTLIPRQYRIEKEHDNKVKKLSKVLTKVRKSVVSDSQIIRESIDEKYAREII